MQALRDGRHARRSCHVCGMWIEIKQPHPASLQAWSCHVCGMWIEMYLPGASSQVSRSHATYVACGLKWLVNILITSFRCHATYVACGLKLTGGAVYGFCARHATYVACGLKCGSRGCSWCKTRSCHVCGMWIEMQSLHEGERAQKVMPRMWHVD